MAQDDSDYDEDIDIRDADKRVKENDSETITTISAPAMKKPDFSKPLPRSKLLGNTTSSFLQRLKDSNAQLNQKIQENGAESVVIDNFDKEGDSNANKEEKENVFKDYVDMDVYVGVLEDKNDDKNNKSQTDSIQKRTDQLLGINSKQNDKQAQENRSSASSNQQNKNNDNNKDGSKTLIEEL